MKKLDMSSINFCDENIQKIADIFPNIITEAKDENGNTTKAIDFELLKQELSDVVVDGNKERYSINWPGKKEAILKANQPINKTLRPVKEDSKNFDTTENLYIEGDNLEALKLLQKSYLGAIKMIYIDPPYNTGKDFIYKDNFTRDKEEELRESGQIDEDGGRLVTNLDSNGRYHSDWLSMMYPRLKLARNLLKDDGVIFISIDDNEVHNLRKICDEIFGEDNFVDNMIWKKRYGGGAKEKYLVSLHEYMLVYAKNIEFLGELFIPLDDESIKRYYKLKDKNFDIRGPYRTHPLEAGKAVDERPNLVFDITAPDGSIIKPKRQWYWNKERVENAILNGEIEFVKNKDGEWTVHSKQYLKDENGIIRQTKAFSIVDDVYSQHGTNETIDIFGNAKLFSYPKPTKLIKKLLHIGLSNTDIILDFFSGSATTAHAVMQQNAEDGGNRKFIMVQIPEPTDPKSEANRAGYKNICEIGKERIRRAGDKILSTLNSNSSTLDIGFRVLKVDSSNMKDIYYTPKETNKESLFDSIDNIKADRTPLDLLFQVLLDSRVELSDKIETKIIKDKEVYFVDENELVACFEDNLNEEFIRELANELKDKDILRVVFKDTAFDRDDLKDNVEQIFKQICPNTEVWAI